MSFFWKRYTIRNSYGSRLQLFWILRNQLSWLMDGGNQIQTKPRSPAVFIHEEAGGDADDNANNDDGNKKGEAVLLAKTNLGKGYGANVTTYSPVYEGSKSTPATPANQPFQPPELLHYIAVGCENGTVVIYRLNRIDDRESALPFEFEKVAECRGHAKAVCAVDFHPRGTQLLSSAKDGTARVFDSWDGRELATLKCEVHDPSGPPPPPPPDPAAAGTRDPRMMRRAPQILVRGCFYGDLEGREVYAVASGKRGPAYLTRWTTSVPKGGATAPAAGLPGAPSFERRYRVRCSPVPVSAVSLSGDGALLALGTVEGSVSLYDLGVRSAAKRFPEVHDLPVTCVASRPVPGALMLPGEAEGGVSFDATSASADNRLGRYALQRRSRIAPPRPHRSARKRGALEACLLDLLRVPLLLVLALTIVAVRDTVDICKEEFGLSTMVMDAGASARHCLYREVLWAEEGRVSFVPE